MRYKIKHRELVIMQESLIPKTHLFSLFFLETLSHHYKNLYDNLLNKNKTLIGFIHQADD